MEIDEISGDALAWESQAVNDLPAWGKDRERPCASDTGFACAGSLWKWKKKFGIRWPGFPGPPTAWVPVTGLSRGKDHEGPWDSPTECGCPAVFRRLSQG